MACRSAATGHERNNADIKMAIIRTSGFKAGQSKDGGLGYEQEVSQTLNAHMSALEPTMMSVRMSEGFKGNNSEKARGIGNGKEVSQTIGAQRAGIEPTMGSIAFAQNTRDEVRKINGDGKIAGALAARPGMKQQNDLMSAKRQTASGIECLCPHQPQSHRVYDPHGAFPSLMADTGKAGQDQASILNNTTKGNTNMTAEVRRLTPVECCRLQGIPDEHPFIHGKSTSDSGVYSVQGNGWARNCSRLVFKNIHTVDGKLNGGVRAFKIGSVSSGQGTHEMSVADFGDKSVFVSEIAPFPCELLSVRFPGVTNFGDVTRIGYDAEKGVIHNRKKDGYQMMSEEQLGFKPVDAQTAELPLKYGELDCLSGGLPCTDCSVAGKRNGAAEGSGTRSALAYELPRIGNECGARWLVYENVPGLFSSNGGTDFAWFLYRLQEAGYKVAWRTLDAQFVRSDLHPRAVPQRRRRIWLVAYRGDDWRVPCEALFEPMKVLGNEPPVRTVGVGFIEKANVCDQTEIGPEDELLEFNDFMKNSKENIIRLLVEKGICISPEERRKELVAAKNALAMACDGGLFCCDLFGPVEKHHQGRGLKAKDLELNLPTEPSLAKVGLANLVVWAKTVCKEVAFCGNLFKSHEGAATVDDLDERMLSNIGNAGFLADGIVCTMKMPEWNAGITEEELAAMPKELAELYDGDVCGLSDILEDDPDPKYKLSWRACYGILKRAVNRKKMLPIELAYALVERIIDEAPIVKWYALNGKDTVKKEGQLSERAIAKIAFDDYVEVEAHWVDVQESAPKKGEEAEDNDTDEAVDDSEDDTPEGEDDES